MRPIINFYVGIIVGTAFVYDLYFRKIPNYLLIAGYAGLVPLMYMRHGWRGAGAAVAGVIAVGVPLFAIYPAGGMGAGDVKLMALMGGFLGVRAGIKYTVLVFFIGAFAGVVKVFAEAAVRVAGDPERGAGPIRRTGIRFSIPILLGYLVLQISGGGIL